MHSDSKNPHDEGLFTGKFAFDEATASVFDDMLERSIPFYQEVLRLSSYFIKAQLDYIASAKAARPYRIYDLGSSTGNFLLQLEEGLDSMKDGLKLCGLDNSEAMIYRASLKAKALGSRVEFIKADLLHYDFKPCHVITAHYTLQFVRPPQRLALIKRLYDALEKDGLIVIAEKVISQDAHLESQNLACYYDYKSARGYTKQEIYKKRSALENVLIPYSLEENLAMLEDAGFEGIETIFKWVNFALFIARKG